MEPARAESFEGCLTAGRLCEGGALDRPGRSVAEVLDLQGWLRENQVEVGLSLLSAVLGRPPMTGLANASTMGLTSRRGLGGRCGGSGVKSGRRRWSPWGLAGAFSGLDIASVPER